MQGIWKRLKFYILGVLMGCVLVFFMFGNRACSFMPSNRIKKTMSKKILVFPENQIKTLNKIGITKDNLMEFLSKAEINFDQSLKDIGTYPRVYVFHSEDNPNKRIQVSLYEDSYIATIHPLGRKGKAHRYEHPKGWGDFVWFPRDSALLFIQKDNETQCKARGLETQNLDSIVHQMKRTGRINFSKSNLMLTKATQFITFKQDSTTVKAQTIWYKSRITFKDFIWDHKLPCEGDSL